MTKIRPLSDLHLDGAPLELEPAGEDVLVLAGDIAVGGFTPIEWADKHAKRLGVPVVVIAGNHELYGACHPRKTYAEDLADLRASAEATDGRVTFLENSQVVRAGVRFIGATLWTDFNLYGKPWLHKFVAQKQMNDYRQIRGADGKRIVAEDTEGWHLVSRDYIEASLLVPFDGPTVVVGHHAPSARSIHSAYRIDDLNPAYMSNLDELVEVSGAALWLHGHTHTSFDYRIGATRVLCNPRGYASRLFISGPKTLYENENPAFDPNLVIDV